MDLRERLIAWLRNERERLDAEIALIAAGRAQVSHFRGKRMIDVTGEALKDLRHRRAELELLLREIDAA